MMSEIKLKVGQRVRLRNGQIHQVEYVSRPFAVGGVATAENGKSYEDGYCLDVVEILSDPDDPKPVPKWEVGKWYPCRGGKHEGKILEMGLSGDYAMAGIVRDVREHSIWGAANWTEEGKYLNFTMDCDDDLMPPAPPPEPKRHKAKIWLPLYAEVGGLYSAGGGHSSEKMARNAAGKSCLAVVPVQIEFTEGEGLPASK